MNPMKIFLGVVIIFLISTFQSCTELRLSVSGVKTTAKVEGILMEVNQKTREPTGKYKVAYEYMAEEEGMRKGFKGEYAVSEKEAVLVEAGQEIEVIYLKSQPMTHRAVGHRGVFWIVIFFVFMAILIVNGVIVWKDAQNDVRRSNRR